MKYDELAFFNQQLAAMLRNGVPLEGALKQISREMRAGPLRSEILLLENDLGQGTPLGEALAKRKLPELYRAMLELGSRSQDLPGVLTLLADHYTRANTLWMRLKGLMVYPLIVLLVSLGLTLLLSTLANKLVIGMAHEMTYSPPLIATVIWFPPLSLAILATLFVAALLLPRWRAWLRWHLPGFREAALAQLASAIALMLKNGTPLADALLLAQKLESASPAGRTLAHWRSLVSAGQGKPSHWPQPSPPFPPLFLWIVANSADDPASGFQKAADLYQARAGYRIELALYGALPISILFLGQMVFWQLAPVFQTLIVFMNALGDMGGS